MIFGFIVIIIVLVALSTNGENANALNAAGLNNFTEWHLDRWFAISWKVKQQSHISLNIIYSHRQLWIVGQRWSSCVKPLIPPNCEGPVYSIAFDWYEKRHDVACCFNWANVFNTLLDFSIKRMFADDDSVSIVYLDIWLKQKIMNVISSKFSYARLL